MHWPQSLSTLPIHDSTSESAVDEAMTHAMVHPGFTVFCHLPSQWLTQITTQPDMLWVCMQVFRVSSVIATSF